VITKEKETEKWHIGNKAVHLAGKKKSYFYSKLGWEEGLFLNQE